VLTIAGAEAAIAAAVQRGAELNFTALNIVVVDRYDYLKHADSAHATGTRVGSQAAHPEPALSTHSVSRSVLHMGMAFAYVFVDTCWTLAGMSDKMQSLAMSAAGLQER
jgi:hypothetical protein